MGKGGSPPPAPTQTQVVRSEIPDFFRPFLEDIFQRSSAVSEEAYVPPPERRRLQEVGEQTLAPIDPAQQAALDRLKSTEMAETGVSAVRAGQGLTLSGAERIGGAEITEAMNPFQQAVTDIAIREELRRAAPQRQAIQAQAARSGAFGTSRGTLLEAEFERNLGQRLADIQTTGGAAAFDRATQRLEQERQRQVGAGQALAGLGAQEASVLSTGVGRQLAAGEAQRGLQTESIGRGLEEFQREVDYPKQQIGFYSGILRGYQPPMNTYTQTAAPFSSTQQILGQAAAAGAIGKGFGLFNDGGIVGLAFGGAPSQQYTESVGDDKGLSSMVGNPVASYANGGVGRTKVIGPDGREISDFERTYRDTRFGLAPPIYVGEEEEEEDGDIRKKITVPLTMPNIDDSVTDEELKFMQSRRIPPSKTAADPKLLRKNSELIKSLELVPFEPVVTPENLERAQAYMAKKERGSMDNVLYDITPDQAKELHSRGFISDPDQTSLSANEYAKINEAASDLQKIADREELIPLSPAEKIERLLAPSEKNVHVMPKKDSPPSRTETEESIFDEGTGIPLDMPDVDDSVKEAKPTAAAAAEPKKAEDLTDWFGLAAAALAAGTGREEGLTNAATLLSKVKRPEDIALDRAQKRYIDVKGQSDLVDAVSKVTKNKTEQKELLLNIAKFKNTILTKDRELAIKAFEKMPVNAKQLMIAEFFGKDTDIMSLSSDVIVDKMKEIYKRFERVGKVGAAGGVVPDDLKDRYGIKSIQRI